MFGQSSLELKFGKYIFESVKSYLIKNEKITNDWNSLNTISENASTVGSFDLGIYKTDDGSNQVLTDLENHKYEIVYLNIGPTDNLSKF